MIFLTKNYAPSGIWALGYVDSRESGGKKKFLVSEIYRPRTNLLKISGPLQKVKQRSSVCRVHYIQNDQLDFTDSTQNLVLKNMHQILTYWYKCGRI